MERVRERAAGLVAAAAALPQGFRPAPGELVVDEALAERLTAEGAIIAFTCRISCILRACSWLVVRSLKQVVDVAHALVRQKSADMHASMDAVASCVTLVIMA